MESFFRRLGRTGFIVSSVGFGSYRVDVQSGQHRTALLTTLGRGVNLVDTSANYSDGGSERLVGVTLQELNKTCSTDQHPCVIVSKVGYLQGHNYELSQQRRAAGRPFLEIVEYAPGLEHCIHPEFIEDQLDRSLARLGQASLDVYLLHNPEYFLAWARKHEWTVEAARTEYYRRVEQAFRHLEKEVERGRIRWYGVSSNTFPHPPADPEFTSLEQCIEIAEAIDPNHHFGVIQFPMNLIETGGSTEKNQSRNRSVLQLAIEKDLGVLINRPLNAMGSRGLVRLADPISVRQAVEEDDIVKGIRQLRALEIQFEEVVLPRLPLDAQQSKQLLSLLTSGDLLEQTWSHFGGVSHWREVHGQHLVPRIQAAVGALLQLQPVAEKLLEWIQGFVQRANATYQLIAGYYEQQTREGNRALCEVVAQVEPEWAAPTLSQSAIRALRSTAGVSCVLVGMRNEDYVADVLEEATRFVEVKPHDHAWSRMAESSEAWK